jgi:hypothetical protein
MEIFYNKKIYFKNQRMPKKNSSNALKFWFFKSLPNSLNYQPSSRLHIILYNQENYKKQQKFAFQLANSFISPKFQVASKMIEIHEIFWIFDFFTTFMGLLLNALLIFTIIKTSTSAKMLPKYSYSFLTTSSFDFVVALVEMLTAHVSFFMIFNNRRLW